MSGNLPVTDIWSERACVGNGRRFVSARSPALAISLLLHGAVLLLLVYRMHPQEIASRIRFFPVELVTLVDRPATPPPVKAEPRRQQSASVAPQTRRAPPQSVPLTPPRETPAAPETGNEP